MNIKILTITGAILLLLLASGTASAASTKVLIVSTDPNVGVVKTYLQNFPDISSVDTFNAGIHPFIAGASYVPTLSYLQAYDVVLVYSSMSYYDTVALGNVLADYVDVGGHVVVATNSFSSGGRLEGRFEGPAGGYAPLFQASYQFDNPYSPSTSGWYDLGNLIMTGVGPISGYYRGAAALTNGATLVASWAENKPFVATKGNVVGIALYPGKYSNSYDWTGNVPLLLHNALVVGRTPDTSIPEFPSVVLPVVAIMGLMFVFDRRKM